jgi:flavin-dependent dehydrogenase
VRCAELVAPAISMLYGDKIEGINNEINYMDTYIEGKLENSINSNGYILDRNVFTGFLIKRFVEQGGYYLNSTEFLDAFYEDTAIKSFGKKCFNDDYDSDCQGEVKDKGIEDCLPYIYVRVKNENITGCLKARILAGADGPLSRVAGTMARLPGKRRSPLNSNYSSECINTRDGFLAGFQQNIERKSCPENHARIFFYPFIPGGYGWLFPKKDSFNAGIAINMKAMKEKGLKEIYSDFRDELIDKKFLKYGECIRGTVTGLVPVCGIREQAVKNNIVLIGDAAGMCNPITGAGNYNAAANAKIISENIKKTLQAQNISMLQESVKDVDGYFGKSIGHALKKRQLLENNDKGYDFRELTCRTWITFREYWHER